MKHSSIHLPIQQIFIEHLEVAGTECTDFRHIKENENTYPQGIYWRQADTNPESYETM